MVKRLVLLTLIMMWGFMGSVDAADRGNILSGETQLNLTISAPAYMDTWNFDGIVGERILINVTKVSGPMTPHIKIYPPGGGPMEASSFGNPFASIDHLVLMNGQYTIVVEDWSKAFEGTYNITFVLMQGTTTSPEDLDGGLIFSGQTIAPGGTMVASDIDVFRFHGEKDSRILITITNTSGSLVPGISLYPPGFGAEEASTYGTPAAKINHQLSQTGIYSIVVEDWFKVNAGGYNICLTKIPGATSHPDDCDGGMLLSGDIACAGIVAADMDVYRFYGDQDDRVLINVSKSSGFVVPQISLYAPGDGAMEISVFGNPSASLDHQILRTGLYTMVVEDWFQFQEGEVNISFTKIPQTKRPGLYNPHPANCSVVGDLTGGFRWDPVSGATGYTLYFGENVNDALAIIGNNFSSAALPFPPTMQHDKIYFWKVAAHLPAGDIEGPWWMFMTTTGVYTFEMCQGLNMISLPYENPVLRTSDKLIHQICGGEVDSIWVYDCAAKMFESWNLLDPCPGWECYAGMPMWVNVTGSGGCTWEIAGESDIDMHYMLCMGMNMVAVPEFSTSILFASDLLVDVPACNGVWRWSRESGCFNPSGFDGYFPISSISEDFIINYWHSYWVNTFAAGDWHPPNP